MHGLQALQGLEVQALVPHCEVVALHQRQAEVTGQVRVFKIRFVVRTGGQQRNVGVGPGAAHLFEPVDQRAVGARQPLHMHRLKRLRKLARNGQPVFQQVTQAGRGLCALRHHPPQAVGPTGEVKRRDVQMGVAHRFGTVHGAQVTRVAMHQCGRQQALRQQLLRAIHIGHDVFEHPHTLLHTGFDLFPALRRDDQGEQVE